MAVYHNILYTPTPCGISFSVYIWTNNQTIVMPILQYEPLDYLSNVDNEATDEELKLVKDLISQELKSAKKLHPKVDQKFPPIPSIIQSSLEEIDSLQDKITFTFNGISESRYQEAKTDDQLDTLVSYTEMHHRSLELLQENTRNLYLINNSQLESIQEGLNQTIARKRKLVDRINNSRKRQQVDFRPLNKHLNNSWKESIKSSVDYGVECARIELASLDS
ncbi:BA75_04652T0 [Komagataella pastoris]|uniref:BA75_04652T0 n=1 Tax=Komagataella pastoris TaxID=4922 RepID=A0A1B2JJ41_PICPA|nr:BA75_04652T0 [Komagataella pastoris]